MNFRTIRLGLAVAAGLLVAQASAAVAGEIAKAPNAAAYCAKKGGVVQTRIPAYDTNGGNPLILAAKRDFCHFTSNKDGSQINVLLKTLATRVLSLAALGYDAHVQRG